MIPVSQSVALKARQLDTCKILSTFKRINKAAFSYYNGVNWLGVIRGVFVLALSLWSPYIVFVLDDCQSEEGGQAQNENECCNDLIFQNWKRSNIESNLMMLNVKM